MNFQTKLRKFKGKQVLIHFPSMKSFKCILDEIGQDFLEVSNPFDKTNKSVINLANVEMVEDFKE